MNEYFSEKKHLGFAALNFPLCLHVINFFMHDEYYYLILAEEKNEMVINYLKWLITVFLKFHVKLRGTKNAFV